VAARTAEVAALERGLQEEKKRADTMRAASEAISASAREARAGEEAQARHCERARRAARVYHAIALLAVGRSHTAVAAAEARAAESEERAVAAEQRERAAVKRAASDTEAAEAATEAARAQAAAAQAADAQAAEARADALEEAQVKIKALANALAEVEAGALARAEARVKARVEALTKVEAPAAADPAGADKMAKDLAAAEARAAEAERERDQATRRIEELENATLALEKKLAEAEAAVSAAERRLDNDSDDATHHTGTEAKRLHKTHFAPSAPMVPCPVHAAYSSPAHGAHVDHGLECTISTLHSALQTITSMARSASCHAHAAEVLQTKLETTAQNSPTTTMYAQAAHIQNNTYCSPPVYCSPNGAVYYNHGCY
jgi:DNA repair exonuclease SbcCD ATPase subunit